MAEASTSTKSTRSTRQKVKSNRVERIGYFSVVDRQVVDPVFKTLNIEQIQKINHRKIPLLLTGTAELHEYSVSPKMLLEFLKKKNAFGSGENESNIISRFGIFYRLMSGHRYTFCNFFKESWNDCRIILMEEKFQTEDISDDLQNYHDGKKIHSQARMNGLYAEKRLIQLPAEYRKQNKISSHNLYVVAKHRYEFDDGMIVNFFISKETDAVYYKNMNEEIVPIELKLRWFVRLVNSKRLEIYSYKDIIADFLVDGLTNVFAVHNIDGIQKVIVIDGIKNTHNFRSLERFKEKMPMFLIKLAYKMRENGLFFIKPAGVQDIIPSIFVGKKAKSSNFMMRCVVPPQTQQPYEKPWLFDAAEHSLVVHKNTEETELQVMNKIKNGEWLYNMNIVSEEHHKKGYFSEFMMAPTEKSDSIVNHLSASEIRYHSSRQPWNSDNYFAMLVVLVLIYVIVPLPEVQYPILNTVMFILLGAYYKSPSIVRYVRETLQERERARHVEDLMRNINESYDN